jgi:hypothetical protein
LSNADTLRLTRAQPDAPLRGIAQATLRVIQIDGIADVEELVDRQRCGRDRGQNPLSVGRRRVERCLMVLHICVSSCTDEISIVKGSPAA